MNWNEFWQNYRNIDIKSDDDLLFQVALTVNKKPISKHLLFLMIEEIKNKLELNKEDILLDLCCGNGVLTHDLAKHCKNIIGIDFSKPFIENAKKYKNKENINYLIQDVSRLDEINDVIKNANKVLFYGSLAYFSFDQIEHIFDYFSKTGYKCIYIGNILNKDKKWNFFNTFKRKLNYLVNYKLLRKDPGLGKWWTFEEISLLAKKYNYKCTFIEQNRLLSTAHYRFDILLTKIN